MQLMLPVSLTLFEVIGVLGFALYVMNYTLLTTRRINGNSVRYFAVNFVAASCVLVGLTSSFNLASALIQIFWVVLSVLGMLVHLRHANVDPA